jgi:hypothetical protein
LPSAASPVGERGTAFHHQKAHPAPIAPALLIKGLRILAESGFLTSTGGGIRPMSDLPMYPAREPLTVDPATGAICGQARRPS